MRSAGRVRPPVLVALVFAVLAAACSEPDSIADPAPSPDEATADVSDESDPTVTLVPPTPTDPPEVEAPRLAGHPVPCGVDQQPAPSSPIDVGVDLSTLVIASGTDQGGVQTAGSGRGAPEAVAALAGWCNALGGLAGRQVVVRDNDAAVVEVAQITEEQCQEVFAVVGAAYILDEEARGARQDCGLPAFPAWGVDDSTSPAGFPIHGHAAALWIDPDANSIALVGYESEGGRSARNLRTAALIALNFEVTGEVVLDPVRPADWADIATALVDQGANQVVIDAACTDVLLPLAAASQEIGYDPVFVMVDSGYDPACLDRAVADGIDLSRLLVELSFLPLEDGAHAPITNVYAEILEEVLAPVTGDALHAAAAFWEFAAAVDGCRAQLTRRCVAQEASVVDGFDANGLLWIDVSCRVVVGVEGTEFVRVLPEEPGGRLCGSEFVAPLPGLDG